VDRGRKEGGVRVHPKAARWLDGAALPVYLVVGPEPVLVDATVDALLARWLPQCEPASFNVARVRAVEGDPSPALAAARTLPMMAERRLVVVRDLEAAPEAFFTALMAYLEAPNPSTVLVLAGAGFPKVEKGGKDWGQRLPKLVGDEGVCRFGDRDADPLSFAMEAATELGSSLTMPAARLLVDLVGPSLARLRREVDKLTLLVDEGAPITPDVVLAAASVAAEPVVWDLTSGIATRRADAALAALRRLLDDGEPPQRLVALVLWQLRLILRMAEMVRAGRSDREIGDALRLRSEVLGPLRAEMGRQMPSAGALLSRVARAQRAMNRARYGEGRALEALVLELVTR
jgi:DNA polymerase-3 subunit delta